MARWRIMAHRIALSPAMPVHAMRYPHSGAVYNQLSWIRLSHSLCMTCRWYFWYANRIMLSCRVLAYIMGHCCLLPVRLCDAVSVWGNGHNAEVVQRPCGPRSLWHRNSVIQRHTNHHGHQQVHRNCQGAAKSAAKILRVRPLCLFGCHLATDAFLRPLLNHFLGLSRAAEVN